MPFPRASGVLLHPTSLPGPYGIGDLGPEAFRFVDWLSQAGPRIWQLLPLGPTGYGDSPYQCFSAFAGNPLLISLDRLLADGLLDESDLGGGPRFEDGPVDYARVISHRRALWPVVRERFDRRARPSQRERFARFRVEQNAWLDDFALFMAVKEAHDLTAWPRWEEAIARRDPAAVAAWTRRCERETAVHVLTQFLFFEQWNDVRAACHVRHIALMGDVPIFVAHDSADVWARRDLFQLDEQGEPLVVAGVPPDYFTAAGQLWGNPHYRWDRIAADGYAWWINRIRAVLSLVDRVRLDHFRGFEAAWEVAGGARTAMVGRWVPGPGAALFEAVRSTLGDLPFVAENLGVITPEVEALRERFGFPGMAILQFAFGTDPQAPEFKPHNYPRNRVAYTGTHDNDTTRGWWTGGIGHSTRSEEELAEERRFAQRYLGTDGRDIHWSFIRAVLSSVADTAIVPAQDLLGLGSEARMNQPGTASGNWRWRLLPGQLDETLARRLAQMTKDYDR
jgi:4-alpha-glucanotransferase